MMAINVTSAASSILVLIVSSYALAGWQLLIWSLVVIGLMHFVEAEQ